MSDLHLELTRGWDLPIGEARPDHDVMIIAGDLIPRMERGIAWLTERFTDKPIIYVPGNHEFYGHDIDRTVEKARKAANGTNVRILQNDAVVIDRILFVGATLWTDFALFDNRDYAMKCAGEIMNDYRKIRKQRHELRLRPADTLARHIETRNFISTAARDYQADRTVIVTHHGCLRETVKAGSENDLLSAAYASDCSDLVEQVDLWIYGHTHESRDFTKGRTRIVSNAKGYGPWNPGQKSENQYFDPKYVLEI
ncbi:metallophosphoesterase [Afipia felis]|nr:metallophosphoesterase [Afipia felis]